MNRLSRFHKFVSALCLLALLPGLFSPSAPARAQAIKTLYAANTPSGTGDCLSWANRCTLQTALAAAYEGDEIWVMGSVSPGMVYKPTSDTNRSISFNIPAEVGVYGGFFGNETSRGQRNPSTYISILSGDIGTAGVHTDNSYHVVTFASGFSAVLDGFTIRHGRADTGAPNGGGIYIINASPTISNVVIENNTASTGSLTGTGGGMYIANSSPVLNGVKFNNNTAETFGGGLYVSNGSPVLLNMEFNANNAMYGGGMYLAGGSPIMTNVKFASNTASESGGGIYAAGSGIFNITTAEFTGNQANAGNGGGIHLYETTININNGTFHQNNARSGGGIYKELGAISVMNSTFSENEATTTEGGGMNTDGGSVTLANVTFSNNIANTNGGGYKSSASANTTMTSAIFTDNIANVNGGGMFTREATVTLTDARFTNNLATKGGGMMNDEAAIITLTGGLFNKNSAGDGGGMYNSGTGTIQLTNATFSDNEASSGGGIYNDASSPGIYNATITANAALFYGGGIYNTNNSDPVIANSIIWDNLPLDEGFLGGLDIHNDASADSPGFWYSIVKGSGGSAAWDSAFGTDLGGNLDSNPLLAPLATNGGFSSTHALGAGSPAIDSADATVCPTTDQRGIPRAISDGDKNGTPRCDRGAFEVAIFTAKSSGAQDGWILESSETSNQGGTLNKGASTLNVGDDAANRQYRAVLSFNTAPLPDNATVSKVTLKVKRSGTPVGGGNPITAFGGFVVDVRKGNFGTSALQLTDFQTKGNKTISGLKPALVSGWYNLNLTGAKAQINKTGNTQIRLRFKLDDNNNSIANFLSIHSGNAGAANRPQLIVEYHIP